MRNKAAMNASHRAALEAARYEVLPTTKIGVGQTVRFLKSHATAFARIAAPGGFSPERFLQKSAVFHADPELRVAGLHLFTFNQVAEAESWRQGLIS